jgi:hypothetical protein
MHQVLLAKLSYLGAFQIGPSDVRGVQEAQHVCAVQRATDRDLNLTGITSIEIKEKETFTNEVVFCVLCFVCH